MAPTPGAQAHDPPPLQSLQHDCTSWCKDSTPDQPCDTEVCLAVSVHWHWQERQLPHGPQRQPKEHRWRCLGRCLRVRTIHRPVPGAIVMVAVAVLPLPLHHKSLQWPAPCPRTADVRTTVSTHNTGTGSMILTARAALHRAPLTNHNHCPSAGPAATLPAQWAASARTTSAPARPPSTPPSSATASGARRTSTPRGTSWGAPRGSRLLAAGATPG